MCDSSGLSNLIAKLFVRVMLVLAGALAVLVWLAPVRAHALTTARDCHEIFQRERITIANPHIQENAFTTDRHLGDYGASLKHDFVTRLAQLPDYSIWFDMGAGQGRAIADAVQMFPKLLAVGVSYKTPEGAIQPSQRVRYLDGDYVENMETNGRLAPYLGKVTVISDVFGPLSYSEDIARILQTYMDLLKKDGTAYINVMTTRNHDGRGHAQAQPEAVNMTDGEALGLIKWLMHIDGVRVELAVDQTGDSELWEKSTAVKITKLDEKVVIPQTLKLESYRAGSPPRRTFKTHK